MKRSDLYNSGMARIAKMSREARIKRELPTILEGVNSSLEGLKNTYNNTVYYGQDAEKKTNDTFIAESKKIKSIRDTLGKYTDYIPPEAISETEKFLTDLESRYQTKLDNSKITAQFKDEKDYNNYIKYGEMKADELKSEIDSYKKYIGVAERRGGDTSHFKEKLNWLEERYSAITAGTTEGYQNDIEKIDREIERLQSEKTSYQASPDGRGETARKNSDTLREIERTISSLQSQKKQLETQKSFSEKYIDKYPDIADVELKYDTSIKQNYDSTRGIEAADLIYIIINDEKLKKYAKGEETAWSDEISEKEEQILQDYFSSSRANGYIEGALEMNEDEKKLFNLCYLESPSFALQFFKDLQDYHLYERVDKTKQQEKYDFAKEHPVRSWIGARGANLLDGLTYIPKLIDPDDRSLDGFTNYSSAVTMAHHDAINNSFLEGAYDVATGVVDLAINLAVSKGAGKIGAAAGLLGSSVDDIAKCSYQILMSSQVASQTLSDARARGVDEGSAIMLSVSAAAIEAITEKFSIEAIFSKPKSVVGHIIKTMGAEGSEEFVASMANTVVDNILTKEKSEYNTRIEELMNSDNSLSREDAEKAVIIETLGEAGYEGLIGAFVGGAIGTATAISPSGRASIKYNKNFSLVQKVNGGEEKLLKLAKEVQKDLKSGSELLLNSIFDNLISNVENAKTKDVKEEYIGALYEAIDSRISGKLNNASKSQSTEVLGRANRIITEAIKRSEAEELFSLDKLEKRKTKAWVKATAYNTIKRNAEGVTLSEADAKDLRAEADTLGEEGEDFIKAYMMNPKVEISQFRDAYASAFNLGAQGASIEAVENSSRVHETLTSNQFTLAHSKGAAAFEKRKASAQEAPEIMSTKAEQGSKRDITPGRVTYDSSVKKEKLSHRQKRMIKVVEAISNVTGISFEFFESELGSDGKYQGESGSFNRKTGLIRIDVNAGKGGIDAGYYAILRTVSHELTHFLATNNEADYLALQEFVFNHIGNEQVSSMLEWRMKGGKISAEDAAEEVTAYACEMMLKDTKAIEQLAKENRTLAEKIFDFISNFINTLREGFEGIEAVSDEAMAMLEYAEELQELWDKALVGAVHNNQHSRQTGAEVNAKAESQTSEQSNKKSLDDYIDEEDYSSDDSKEGDNLETVEEEYLPFEEREIIGADGTNYGIGVYINGNYFANLTDSERKKKVKNFAITKLAGNRFIAYDSNNKPIDIRIANNKDKIKNKGGKNKSVLRELYNKYNGFKIKQEAIVLIDELIANAKYSGPSASNYSHDWLDNYGQNEWDYWKVYLQEKNKTIWEATLNIANTANGEKILYDIDPIKMVEDAIKSAVTATNNSIHNSEQNVKENLKNFSDIMKEDRQSELTDSQAVARALEKVSESDPEYKILKEYDSLSKEVNRAQRQVDTLQNKIMRLRNREDSKLEAEDNKKAVAEWIKTAEKRISELQDRIVDGNAKLKKLIKGANIEAVLNEEKKRHRAEVRTEADKEISKYRAARERTDTINKLRRLRELLATKLSQNNKSKHVPLELMETVKLLLESLTDTTSKDVHIKKKMDDFAEKYKAISENQEYSEVLKSAYDSELYKAINEMSVKLKSTPLSELNNFDLNRIYEITKQVFHTVSNANKLFSKNIKLTLDEAGKTIFKEIRAQRKAEVRIYYGKKALDNRIYSLYKPKTFFKKLGSPVLLNFYKELQEGEYTYYLDTAEAKQFKLKTAKDFGIDNEDFQKVDVFTAKNGEKIVLTKGQVMSLYAYSKREQAMSHLLGGGFVQPNSETKAVDISDSEKEKVTYDKNTKLSYKLKDADAHSLSEENINRIIQTLTADERAFVDKMQGYLSKEMAQKGNEVTLRMIGIVKFTERNYFPIRTADNFRAFKEGGENSIPSLTTPGFAHDTIEAANNPLVLDDFLETWGSHVSQMSMFHSFAGALSDFQRVTNFKNMVYDEEEAEDGSQVENNASYKDKEKNIPTKLTVVEQQSVMQEIQAVFGKAAENYIDRFIEDVNGGIKVNDMLGVDKLLSKFKKAKVFLSLSVVLQQPSSIARAKKHLSLRALVGSYKAMRRPKNAKSEWEELKEYCPIAGIKEMGYFDMNVGRSGAQYVIAEEYDKLTEKAVAFFKDGDYRDEVMAYLPAKADETTWCWIWRACQNETLRKGKYKKGSEEHLKAAAELFNDVITETQVYDSVFSRAQVMRNKDTFSKMATVFMAEPLTSLNMLMEAIDTKSKKEFAKTASILVMQSFINSMLCSLAAAMRDDDDEEMSFFEKYAASVVTNFIDNVNPLGWIPLVRDVLSLIKGYDIERTDMSLIGDLADSTYALANATIVIFSEDKSWSEKGEEILKNAEKLLGTIGDMFGIPASNISRDAKAFYRTFISRMRAGKDTSLEGIKNAIHNDMLGDRFLKIFFELSGAETNKNDMYYSDLYAAVLSGDDEKYNLALKKLKDSGKDTKQIQSGFKTFLQENDERIEEGYQYRQKRETAAESEDSAAYKKWDGKYNSLIKELTEDGFDIEIVVSAISGYKPEEEKENDDGDELTEKAEAKAEKYKANVYELTVYKLMGADDKVKTLDKIDAFAKAEVSGEEMNLSHKKADIAQDVGISPAEFYAILQSAVDNTRAAKIRAINESHLSEEEKSTMVSITKATSKNIEVIEKYVKENYKK